MKQFFSRIVNAGITEGERFVLRNRLRVFNTAIFSVLVISIFYFFLALAKEYYLSTLGTAYSVLQTAAIIVMVRKQRYTMAFHFAMWYGLVLLTAFTFLFGAVTNSYYYFMFLPVACNLLFDDRRTINWYFGVIVVVMLANVYAIDHVKPYYSITDAERWMGYPNVPFVLMLVFLAVRMFKNENRKYAVQVEEQKEAIEEKNKEITASIHYAQRIQAALLAPAALMKKHLPEHFILYKPKDIVSGDFYFAAETGGKFWLCVGDCTGHGVPGAFMSLLNISTLRELIVDQRISSPDRVLHHQREHIIRALNPDGVEESGKDGMDCVLAAFDFQKGVLQFACANNPVWIIRNGALTEFKPDKQPVGMHEGEVKPYTLHEWKWQSGDLLYFLTDGFADQFGGPRGKKFKYAQLKEKLLKHTDEPVSNQHEILSGIFQEWRGDLEQVDDVLIIGIRIS